MRVAKVIVDIPARAIDEPFDYQVTEGQDLAVGHCVLVDVGSRPAVGYVVGIDEEPSPGRALKPVRDVLGGPYFHPASVEVAAWIAREYVCPPIEALRLFLPPGGTPRVVRRARGGTGTAWEVLRPPVGPKDDRWVGLTPGGHAYVPSARATAQRAILDALASGPMPVSELFSALGRVDSALRALVRAEAVWVEIRRQDRVPATQARPMPAPERLSRAQETALSEIATRLDGGGGVVVLEGVTGSGKTEVYVRAIEDALARGLGACVLVPEIALTPQTVGRFRSRLGDAVAVLHSRLSPGERYDQWMHVLAGERRVVIGPRSALFAPIMRLGIVIVDEEHEPSYKQAVSPRYHARAVAERLCQEHGAVLVLGSATPSLEARAACEAGRWVKVSLPERVTGCDLPSIEVVDLAAEFREGHRGMFSRTLRGALDEVRGAGKKAMVFLNRRGFASFLLCRECGFVPQCGSCSTSMTYHEVGCRLACHHCGSVRPVPATCPECGSAYLRAFGAGTQRVEAELRALHPGWPIVRMDADTTRGKGAHERLLAQFEALETGVLLGTQMIAKGLDYPDVTLVAVVSADTAMHVPDFRAAERTFQLLEQVAGRSGRGVERGRVVIQTYWPDHPAVVAVAAHDPERFYLTEAAVRSELGYPPYGRLANVIVRGGDEQAVAAHAAALFTALSDAVPAGVSVLGPSPAVLRRLNRVWRWHVLLKGPAEADLPGAVRDALSRVRAPRGVSVAVDVDPMDLA